MILPALRSAVLGFALALPAFGQGAPSAVDGVKSALATADHAPFTFTYDGKEAASILPGWTKSEADAKSELGFSVHQIIYRDPVTKLKVTVEIRTLAGFPAIDWVLFFSNEGTADTPILENIQPLHTTVACDAPAILHSASGSGQSVGDFWPRDTSLPAGQPVGFGTTTGRSSDALRSIDEVSSFPFFNLQTGKAGGVFGAIGWTGDWKMQVQQAADIKSVALEAGMSKTHLLLHAGETIRSPRIVLMDWSGDREDAQNQWRKLMLADYSPKTPDGKTVTEPLCFCSGGDQPIADKIAVAHFLHDKKIPADLYWIDAGWYGDKTKDWVHNRGSWTPIPDYYPNGFAPLGDALKEANVGFLLWIEAETAMPGTTFPTQHPDWYIAKPPGSGPDDGEWPMCLNLANPAALKGMTDFISKLITDAHMTWYRQDFNFCPATYWHSQDKPDRVGMTEIGHIEGLYAFWDALRAQHPGLQIDNCSSGGRRLDIETASRSVALHRSDCAGIPLGEQFHTQGLVPWVPLNDGIVGAPVSDPTNNTQLYNWRSGYCTGGNYSIDAKNFNNDAVLDPMRQSLQEFLEVRPYYYADFHPLQPISLDTALWAAWQLNRPEKGDGAILCLRRPDSIFCTLQTDLKHIDPAATYEVEVRTSLTHAAVKEISGADFAHFSVTIPDKPGSAVVFYRKKGGG